MVLQVHLALANVRGGCHVFGAPVGSDSVCLQRFDDARPTSADGSARTAPTAWLFGGSLVGPVRDPQKLSRGPRTSNGGRGGVGSSGILGFVGRDPESTFHSGQFF